ncbi:MAG: 4-hydroxybutyrate--acetyl-CoA CoA transferase [Treponema sp.]|jgi:acyl-CoA hydrolase|nr:4-hydroxybutyrate--acetyl-CoA CoA transferase [Treponema sp.]
MGFDYSGKVISVEKALSMVKDGDHIVTGMAAAEAHDFFMDIHKIVDRGVKNVTVSNCLPMAEGKYLTDPDYIGKINVNAWFYTPQLRRNHAIDAVSYVPNHLHNAGWKRRAHLHTNIFICNASPPDKHGFMAISLSATYERAMRESADLVILEINPNVPRAFGDVEVHINDVDYLIETNYAIPEVPDPEPSELDWKIGKLVANEIRDGDCIQLGIGGMPNAIAKSLYDKKDLGIHTEMLTSEMSKLFKAGVITGRRKKIQPGKMACTFVFGTRQMYDFVDDNPGVIVLSGEYMNDPFIIALNDNQVSINSSVEIDVTGQCASESIGTKQISGTGGQVDTAVGAQRSKDGRSYICLYSTATIKDKDGQPKRISKIVPTLNQGAIVSLSRMDVDRVVTEYGIAELRGTNVRERVQRLVGIAHPDFREELMRQSMDLGIIGRQCY